MLFQLLSARRVALPVHHVTEISSSSLVHKFVFVTVLLLRSVLYNISFSTLLKVTSSAQWYYMLTLIFLLFACLVFYFFQIDHDHRLSTFSGRLPFLPPGSTLSEPFSKLLGPNKACF